MRISQTVAVPVTKMIFPPSWSAVDNCPNVFVSAVISASPARQPDDVLLKVRRQRVELRGQALDGLH